MWVLCGTSDGVYPNGGTYYSTNGANWILSTGSAAVLGGRTWSSAAVFNGRIWLVGGGNSGNYAYMTYTYPEIWTSADGVHWNKDTTQPFYPRFAAEMTVYNNQLWLIAGGW